MPERVYHEISGETARKAISEMTVYRTKPTERVVQAVQMKVDFTIVQDSDDAEITGRMYCKAGCWLIYTGVAFYPVTDATFRAQYEELGHEPIPNVQRH